jgi:hypothetical protein
MTITEQNFAERLKRDPRGAIVYTFRGNIERGVGSSYKWFPGYSAATVEGHVLYPWMRKQECYADAKRFECRAVFEDGSE